MKQSAVTKSEHSCEFCGRSFVREKTLFTHLCEQKRRWDERERPYNRIAYGSWLNYFRRNHPSTKKTEQRDFIKSPYYSAFIKFGTYCVDSRVVNPHSFCEWLVKGGVAIDNWASDKQYTRYLVEYVRLENGLEAVERSVITLLKLAEEEHIQLGDVFRLYSKNKLCYLMSTGHISPWVLYHSEGGLNFLGSLNQDQQNLIFEYINPEIWNIKFKRDSEVVKEVKSLLKSAGI